MGSIVETSCPCGFSMENLFVGGGMGNYDVFNGVVALCLECNEIAVANYMEEKPTCSTCGGTLAFYLTPTPAAKEAGKSPQECSSWPDTDMHGCLCPSCGRMAMEFRAAGCWD